MSIRAIETAYKGYRFRSRLEARWAVFFDALGIEWQYEPEGFELPGGVRYLPDFFLPKFECHASGLYVEVKPDGGSFDKAAQLAIEGGVSILCAEGVPDVREYTVLAGDGEYPACFNHFVHRAYRLYSWPRGDDFGPDAFNAVCAARGARFEHGEHGAPAR